MGGQDEVVGVVVLHLGAAVLAVDHLVADRQVERDAVAVVVDAAGTEFKIEGDELLIVSQKDILAIVENA